ncbi:hypothetical protein GCM10023321_60660 [Pseudonocardia eucalypti]|uniref:Uncharacterized protein n=1 Tax=Pseudonocardia eucalypti TaxID=648755 RepID=A0ABP9QUM5_9PSEU
MPLTSQLRRLAWGERACKVLVEVADLSPAGWRRLAADPELRWRRLSATRPAGGTGAVRRRRGRLEPAGRTHTAAPTPAVLEASGVAGGTAAVAKQRLAAHALARLHAAGLDGEVVGAALAEPEEGSAAPSDAESVWPASHGVLIFGPARQEELDRRFALAAQAWSLNGRAARPPVLDPPGERRRRARVDLLAGLCVLPLLLMLVATVGPWLSDRAWVLLLAAAALCVVVPVLVVQALANRRPGLAPVRGRALGLAAALIVLVLVARVLAHLPVPPLAVMVGSAVLIALLTPVVARLAPTGSTPRAASVLLVLGLAVLAAPVGELLDGVYLGRLGLRATDVSLTFAQRWWSGAFFGVTALAGLMLIASVWGWVRQLDAVGRRRARPPAPLLALFGLVYAAALLALASTVAWQRAGTAAADALPGEWGGINPAWVCWSPVSPPGAVDEVGFAGRALPPTGHAVAWLGTSDDRYSLWSAETGGVTVTDRIRLRLRDQPGPC